MQRSSLARHLLRCDSQDQPVALDADMFRRWPDVADLSKPQPDRVQSERDDDKTYDTIHVRIRN